MTGCFEFSLQHKLQGIVVASCAVALLVASTIFTVNDQRTFLQGKQEDLVASAKMIGSISTAALRYEDVQSAQEILRVFEADPQIALVCIYQREEVLAVYRRAGAQAGICPRAKLRDESSVDARKIARYQRIFAGEEALGGVYLEADLADMHERLIRIVAVDAVTVVVSLLIAFLLSYRLQRVISRPIRELAKTASLSARGDHSLRARKWSNDEIGLLCDQFNGMLERIQQRDQTVQKAYEQLEERVAERTEYLNAVLDNSPLAIMVLDKERKLQLCNPAFEQMFQYSRSEILGKPVDGTVIRGAAVQEAQKAAQETAQGRAVRMVTQRTRRDGTTVEVEGYGVPLQMNGQIIGSLVLYLDISERLRAERAMQQAKEQAEAASRAKSEFMANMSHEIRTPMNGIMGMTDLVLDTELDAEQREYLNMAKSSADALLTLINDILDFSKIEAGKLEIDRIEFSLIDSLGETMKSLSLRAHQKGLELAYELQADVPDRLIGDPGRLRQIIVNLVGNAVKFTEHGEVILNVGVESRGAGEVCLHFMIRDTGIGIPEDKRGSIFEAFTQADGSMTRTYGGTGLGLTISSRLVQCMGGNIWVESEVGRGSRFHFTAKFGAPEAAWKKTVERERRSLREIDVLVVDDNETNRRILMKMLSGWSAKPVGVASGAEAMVVLRDAQMLGRGFPLILLDAQMPVTDGFALVEQIKLNPQWNAATIMMLSSAGQRGDARRCRELGVAAYLTKPVRTGELLEAILVALGNGVGGVVPAAEKAAPLVTRHSLREAHARLRILLVEDNPVNQRLAIRLLEKRGHAVTLAGNGEEALAAVGRAEFDLAFMDVQMPVMDGLQATAAIRAREKIFGGHLKIVAMTAHAMVSDQQRCLTAGMDDYLSKPLQQDALDEMLRKLADGVRGRLPELDSVVSDEIQR